MAEEQYFTTEAEEGTQEPEEKGPCTCTCCVLASVDAFRRARVFQDVGAIPLGYTHQHAALRIQTSCYQQLRARRVYICPQPLSFPRFSFGTDTADPAATALGPTALADAARATATNNTPCGDLPAPKPSPSLRNTAATAKAAAASAPTLPVLPGQAGAASWPPPPPPLPGSQPRSSSQAAAAEDVGHVWSQLQQIITKVVQAQTELLSGPDGPLLVGVEGQNLRAVLQKFNSARGGSSSSNEASAQQAQALKSLHTSLGIFAKLTEQLPPYQVLGARLQASGRGGGAASGAARAGGGDGGTQEGATPAAGPNVLSSDVQAPGPAGCEARVLSLLFCHMTAVKNLDPKCVHADPFPLTHIPLPTPHGLMWHWCAAALLAEAVARHHGVYDMLPFGDLASLADVLAAVQQCRINKSLEDRKAASAAPAEAASGLYEALVDVGTLLRVMAAARREVATEGQPPDAPGDAGAGASAFRVPNELVLRAQRNAVLAHVELVLEAAAAAATVARGRSAAGTSARPAAAALVVASAARCSAGSEGTFAGPAAPGTGAARTAAAASAPAAAAAEAEAAAAAAGAFRQHYQVALEALFRRCGDQLSVLIRQKELRQKKRVEKARQGAGKAGGGATTAPTATSLEHVLQEGALVEKVDEVILRAKSIRALLSLKLWTMAATTVAPAEEPAGASAAAAALAGGEAGDVAAGASPSPAMAAPAAAAPPGPRLAGGHLAPARPLWDVAFCDPADADMRARRAVARVLFAAWCERTHGRFTVDASRPDLLQLVALAAAVAETCNAHLDEAAAGTWRPGEWLYGAGTDGGAGSGRLRLEGLSPRKVRSTQSASGLWGRHLLLQFSECGGGEGGAEEQVCAPARGTPGSAAEEAEAEAELKPARCERAVCVAVLPATSAQAARLKDLAKNDENGFCAPTLAVWDDGRFEVLSGGIDDAVTLRPDGALESSAGHDSTTTTAAAADDEDGGISTGSGASSSGGRGDPGRRGGAGRAAAGVDGRSEFHERLRRQGSAALACLGRGALEAAVREIATAQAAATLRGRSLLVLPTMMDKAHSSLGDFTGRSMVVHWQLFVEHAGTDSGGRGAEGPPGGSTTSGSSRCASGGDGGNARQGQGGGVEEEESGCRGGRGGGSGKAACGEEELTGPVGRPGSEGFEALQRLAVNMVLSRLLLLSPKRCEALMINIRLTGAAGHGPASGRVGSQEGGDGATARPDAKRVWPVGSPGWSAQHSVLNAGALCPLQWTPVRLTVMEVDGAGVETRTGGGFWNGAG